MIKFKRQTTRSTKMDECRNINLFLNGLEFGIIESVDGWGEFDEFDEKDPLIEFKLDRQTYTLTLKEFKEVLRAEINYDKTNIKEKAK